MTAPEALLQKTSDGWSTALIDIRPDVIRPRGIPIQHLIGKVSYAQMVWLMLRGELPKPAQAQLLEAALVAAVDHGPQAPSIAIARMAVSCGTGLNGAMASAINVLDGVHGGAGEQCLTLYRQALVQVEAHGLEPGVDRALQAHADAHGRIVPGFGRGFEPPLARGLFILSRSVGILAHAWEQQGQSQRIKGPMPPELPCTYTGP